MFPIRREEQFSHSLTNKAGKVGVQRWFLNLSGEFLFSQNTFQNVNKINSNSMMCLPFKKAHPDLIEFSRSKKSGKKLKYIL
ncbi:hypothetical protein B6D60_02685 [candidate division KSB1 bacterium 4484_87]|nr:MAG: hypothetical protein B6D60_02685 [candidate division KSB1 bacterium 4484_87]